MTSLRRLLPPGLYDDWRWSGRGRNFGPTIPAFADLMSSGVHCWQYENGDELHFSDLQIPHDYAEGTDMVPHLHWIPTTSEVYTGVWALEYVDWLSVTTGSSMQAKKPSPSPSTVP